jgi:hypothetical protein
MMPEIDLQDATFIPLSTLLEKIRKGEISKSQVKKLLKTFKCPQNKDVEGFLHKNALKFEEINLARTYLWIFRERVVAYFTIALKAISLDEDTIQAIQEKKGENFDEVLDDLLKGYPLGDKNKQIPVYLIGQVGKAPDVKKLNGYIVKVALEKIREASRIVGGQIAVLDVVIDENYQKLFRFYKNLGFSVLYDVDERLIRLYYKFI